MIASDMDGTLLGADGRLSARTVAAIEAATAAGIVVAAATGRSHLSAAPRLVPAVPAMRWAVCSNGATLFDLHADAVVGHNPIADHHLAHMAEVWDRLSDIGLGWEDVDGFGADPIFDAKYPSPDGPAEPSRNYRPPATGVLKILVSHDTMTGPALLELVRGHIPDELEVATSGAPFVEITAAGVNKAYGLSQLSSQLGITADETMVFGDNNNDLAMFAWAGRAVAMGNATTEVRAIAHEVADHHANDGVAKVIEALLRG
jgi:Cof subfamily protein (haloacid dehalogenase superfamily)